MHFGYSHAMAIVLVQVALAHDSALPEDVTVNTWHCSTTLTDGAVGAQNFIDDLKTFYTAIDNTVLGVTIAGPALFKAYDLADPLPRVPIVEDSQALTSGSQVLPQEVALCLSYQAAPISGVNQASRRGRVFLGPIYMGACNPDTGRPETAQLTTIATAADALLAAANADTTYDWVVYSPTNDTVAIVDNGWIDNAFDTVRSRGVAPTARTIFDG